MIFNGIYSIRRGASECGWDSVVDFVRSSDCVVWMYVAAKLASEFTTSTDTSVHVYIRCCIIVGEKLFKIMGAICAQEKVCPTVLMKNRTVIIK